MKTIRLKTEVRIQDLPNMKQQYLLARTKRQFTLLNSIIRLIKKVSIYSLKVALLG